MPALRLALMALLSTSLCIAGPSAASAAVTVSVTNPKMDLDEVVAAGGSVPVLVGNRDTQPQRVEVRLVGLATAKDKAVASIAPSSVLSDIIPPSKSDIVALPLDAATRPAPDTYKGSIVAAGALGGVASVPVRLTVASAASKPPPPSATPARLLPKTLSDFSVSGVNFIPSLLDPMPSATFGAGLLLAILLLPFVGLDFKWMGRFRRPGLRPKRVKGIHVVVGYALAAVLLAGGGKAAFGKGDDGFFEGKGLSLVEVSSPEVDKSADQGVVGALVAKDGTPAMAVVTGTQLQTRYAPRAGAYEGKVDLLAGEGGDAKMTANVRDYWPWALLVISVGVGLGAAVTRYFTVKRGRHRNRLDLLELEEEIRAADDAFRKDIGEDAYSKYSLKKRLDARLADIEKRLARGEAEETKKARDDLDAVRSYFHTAQEMWDNLTRLPQTANDVARLAEDHEFSVYGERVPAVRQARRLLGTRFVDALPDEKSADLDARKKEVDDAAVLLDELVRDLPEAAKLRDEVAAGESDRDKAEERTHRTALQTALNGLVTATALAEARTHMGEVATEHGALLGYLPPNRRKAAALPPPDVRPADAESGRPALVTEPPDDGEVVAEQQEGGDGGGPPAPSESSAAAWRRFLAQERQMTMATGVLAIFSGLILLYFASPTWGTPGDYLKALLWGSVVSEGVKQVTALVARTGPAS